MYCCCYNNCLYPTSTPASTSTNLALSTPNNSSGLGTMTGRWTGDPYPSETAVDMEDLQPSPSTERTTNLPSPPISPEEITSIPQTPPERGYRLKRLIPSGHYYSTGRPITISFEESPPMRITRGMEKRRAQIRALLHDTPTPKQDQDKKAQERTRKNTIIEQTATIRAGSSSSINLHIKNN